MIKTKKWRPQSHPISFTCEILHPGKIVSGKVSNPAVVEIRVSRILDKGRKEGGREGMVLGKVSPDR